jgi:hypothetical protein
MRRSARRVALPPPCVGLRTWDMASPLAPPPSDGPQRWTASEESAAATRWIWATAPGPGSAGPAPSRGATGQRTGCGAPTAPEAGEPVPGPAPAEPPPWVIATDRLDLRTAEAPMIVPTGPPPLTAQRLRSVRRRAGVGRFLDASRAPAQDDGWDTWAGAHEAADTDGRVAGLTASLGHPSAGRGRRLLGRLTGRGGHDVVSPGVPPPKDEIARPDT